VTNQNKSAFSSSIIARLMFLHLFGAVLWAASAPLIAMAELRYQLEESCSTVPGCRTECEDALLRTQQLDSCLVALEQEEGSTRDRKCQMERVLEMRTYYKVVGCLIYFYPRFAILPSQRQ